MPYTYLQDLSLSGLFSSLSTGIKPLSNVATGNLTSSFVQNPTMNVNDVMPEPSSWKGAFQNVGTSFADAYGGAAKTVGIAGIIGLFAYLLIQKKL